MPEKWTPVGSSHLIDLALDRFVSFFHYINKVGIHEVNDKICTQNGEQCQQEDTHEKVLMKERRS